MSFSLEVKQSVWDYDSYKSPGLYGISFGFIKEFWNLLKDDFIRFLSKFHRNGRLTKGLNATFNALIPKINSSQRLNDYRPISLVGCMYKVLAKILANDTLITADKSWLNVRSIRVVLLVFEEVSGLKVNFHKSMLTGVNISYSWLSEAAAVMNCKKKGPFLLYIWVCLLEEMLERLVSGNLLLIVLLLAYRRGITSSFLSVVV